MLKNPLIIFLLFLVIGLGVYANSFNNEFFWDDDDSIVDNAYIKDWKHFPDFFTENLIAGSGQISNYYRPVLLISFALDYHIWGLNTLGFHFTNTILHILCAWMIFLVFARLTSFNGKRETPGRVAAFFAALLFLVHPLQTEAVTYVAGRADPLSSFFSLLSLWFFLDFRSAGSKNKRRSGFVLCLLFFIAGILTKEQVILMPLIFLSVDAFFFVNGPWKNRFLAVLKRNWIPLFISLIYFLIHFTLLDFKGDMSFETGNELYDSSVWSRLFTFCLVMFSYFRLLFLPFGLHMARQVQTIASLFSWPVISFLILLSVIAWVGVKTWKKDKFISFGFLWFFIILLPRTNIISINRPMYEHWLYLPMVGFWLALVSLVLFIRDSLNKQRAKQCFNIVFTAIFIFLLVGFSFLTIKRNIDWKDPITFYNKNLEYTPDSVIQLNNLGKAYDEKGYTQKAISQYRRAIEIKDKYPQVHYNLANTLIRAGEREKAIEEYKKAINMSNFSPAYINLINLYSATGENKKAEKLHQEFKSLIKD